MISVLATFAHFSRLYYMEIQFLERGQTMIYRRKTYKIDPQRLEEFNRFFHTWLLPNQRKHGARLVGRWVAESKDEIVAIWEYDSMEAYKRIESAVQADQMNQQAAAIRKELEPLYLESRQDFLLPTGAYHPPKHIVGVFGYITNEQGEVLVVKSIDRPDTWELPGGQVEAGETLEEAAKREIREESGIEAELTAVTGVYHNVSSGIVAIGFRGVATGGLLAPSIDETSDAMFVKLDTSNAARYFTRPQLLTRVLDAMSGSPAGFEAFRVNPYELLRRIRVE
jgi:8-oxo-dGTP diphosphatase